MVRGRAQVVPLAAWLSLVVAASCQGTNEDNPQTPLNKDAGVTTGGADGAGTQDAPGALLCSKYGGYTKVQQLVDASLATIFNDCKIGGFFQGLQDSDKKHMTDCMEKQIGTFLNCPGVVYDTDSSGTACRSMNDAHQNLGGITQGDFDAFENDIIATLKGKGISSSDISADFVPQINATAGDIVTDQTTDLSQSICVVPGVDAGDDGGGEGGAADASDGASATDAAPDVADGASPTDASDAG
jgi:hypothetical protein